MEKIEYRTYGVVTDIDVFEVVACDHDSAVADVRQAFPDARIIQVCFR